MEYIAITERDGDRTTIEFPDCPGCATFAEPDEDVLSVAREALEGWLDAELAQREAPPRPAFVGPTKRGRKALAVDIPMALAVRLTIRWARADAGLSQGELAQRIGMTRQQLSRIESPDSNITVAMMERIAKGLGAKWDLSIKSSTAA
jgi:antitoxin HicB